MKIRWLVAGLLVLGGLGNTGALAAEVTSSGAYGDPAVVSLQENLREMEARMAKLEKEQAYIRERMNGLDPSNPNQEGLYSELKLRLSHLNQEMEGWKIEISQVSEELQHLLQQQPGTVPGTDPTLDPLFQELKKLEAEHQRIEEMIGNSDRDDDALRKELAAIEAQIRRLHEEIQGGGSSGNDPSEDPEDEPEPEPGTSPGSTGNRWDQVVQARLRASLRKLVQRAVEAGYKSGKVRRPIVEKCMRADSSSENQFGMVMNKISEVQKQLFEITQGVAEVHEQVGQTECMRKSRVHPSRPVLNALRRTQAFLEGYRQGISGAQRPTLEGLPFFPEIDGDDPVVGIDDPEAQPMPEISVEQVPCDSSQAGANALVGGGVTSPDCEEN